MSDPTNDRPNEPPREIVFRDAGGWISGPSETVPESSRPVTTAWLSRAYPGWTITFDDATQVYYAERQAGTATHVLAAYLPSELAGKIDAAEQQSGDDQR